MQEDLYYLMEKALREAKKGFRRGEVPVGAVLAGPDGEIVARAHNRPILFNDPTAHAEVVAVRKACNALGSYQLEGCILYTSCEPCPMCLGAIYWARPDKVYYAATRKDAAASGFDDDLIYNEIDLHPQERQIPFMNEMRDEALKAFRLWDESELKIKY